MWAASLPILCANGAVLAVHFSAWSWSIQETTLVHSLLFVSTTPLLLVGWAAVLWALAMIATPKRYDAAPQSDGALAMAPRPDVARTACAGGDQGQSPGDSEDDRACLVAPPKPSADTSASSSQTVPATGASEAASPTVPAAGGGPLVSMCTPSRAAAAFMSWGPHLPPTLLEIIGTVVGFSGAVLLTLDVKEAPVDNSGGGGGYSDVATLRGDLVATAGAAAMGVCLALGSGARRWAPLWIYAWTVTASAAVAAALASYALEPAARSAGLCCGSASLFGWMADPHLFGLLTATAFVSGICGHTFANAALSVRSCEDGRENDAHPARQTPSHVTTVSVPAGSGGSTAHCPPPSPCSPRTSLRSLCPWPCSWSLSLAEPSAGRWASRRGGAGLGAHMQPSDWGARLDPSARLLPLRAVQGPPSPLTLIAAPVLLLGAAGVIVGAREGGVSKRLEQALLRRCCSRRPVAVSAEPGAHIIASTGAGQGVDASSKDIHPAPSDSEASPLAAST